MSTFHCQMFCLHHFTLNTVKIASIVLLFKMKFANIFARLILKLLFKQSFFAGVDDTV